MTGIRSPLRILLVALALGWLADILFYGNNLGISVLFFVLLVLGGLLMLGWAEGVGMSWRNLWLIPPLLFFATMVFVRANDFLTFLNIVAVISLVCLLLFFYAADRFERLGVFGYPAVIGLALQNMLVKPLPVVNSGVQTVLTHKRRFRLAIPVARGIIIAIPILLVFTVLLASADQKFANYIDKIIQFKFFNTLPDLLWQLVLILSVAWLVAGSYFYAYSRPRGLAPDKSPRENLPGTMVPGRVIGFVEGTTVLVLVDLLFLAFAWVQVTYLFSGEAQRTLKFEAYRDYVRRGFMELLIASILTMILILGLRWAARHDKKSHERIFLGLSSLMIVLAMLMLVSAFQRMLVWESIDYYINTEVRLYVRAFIIWLGLTFVWLFFTMWLNQQRFAIGLFVAAIGFLVTINLMNPDYDVAEYNLGRKDDLSVRYLYNLSDDAVPALVAGFDQTSGQIKERLRSDLSRRLKLMEAEKSRLNWPSFHLARWQAYDLLTTLRRDGKIT